MFTEDDFNLRFEEPILNWFFEFVVEGGSGDAEEIRERRLVFLFVDQLFFWVPESLMVNSPIIVTSSLF